MTSSDDDPTKPYRFVAVIYQDEAGRYFLKMRLPMSGQIIVGGPFATRAEVDREVEDLRKLIEQTKAAAKN